jgi:ribonuclease R
LVHRHLWEVLMGTQQTQETADHLESMATESSARERDAADAERQSVAFTQARYMKDKVGQIFTGMVTGMTGSGVFLSETSTKTEGLGRYRDIAGDGFWDYDEKSRKAINRKTKQEIRIGDRARMKLTKVDVKNRMIDWELVAFGDDVLEETES